MRKLIGASLLALALSLSTYAGEMPFGVTDTPPVPSDGIMHGDSTAPSDGWIGTGVALAQTALSLF